MSSAIATHSFAANVLRVGARNAGRTAPSRANRMTVRAIPPSAFGPRILHPRKAVLVAVAAPSGGKVATRLRNLPEWSGSCR